MCCIDQLRSPAACAVALRQVLTMIASGDYAGADKLVMEAQAAFNSPI